MLYKIIALEEECAILRLELLARKEHCNGTPYQMYSVRVARDAAGKLEFPFTYVNQTQVNTVGIFSTPKEMIDKTDFDCFMPESALSAYNDFSHVVESRKAINKEETFFDTLGRKHIFRVTKTPQLNSAGEVIAIHGISIDITKEKALENIIKEDRARYKQGFYLSPSLLTKTDAVTREALAVNRHFHITHEYCIAIDNLDFTDEETSQINSNYGLLYVKKERKLYLTPLINALRPEYQLLIDKNNPEIFSGLAKIYTDEYRIIGKSINIINTVPYSATEQEKFTNEIAQGVSRRTVEHKTRTGKILTMDVQVSLNNDSGRMVFDGVDIDITEETALRKELEEKNRKLEQLALYNDVSGLPRETLFKINTLSALAGAYRTSKDTPCYVVITYIDLLYFKFLNDKNPHKHSGGDQALREVGARLQKAFPRKTDTVAHLHGDEFCILLTGIKNPEQIHTLEKKISNAIDKQLFCIGGEDFKLEASFGSCIYSIDSCSEDLEEVYKDLMIIADKRLAENKEKQKQAAEAAGDIRAAYASKSGR